ncbi:vacuolar ATPase assembly integral membrane protein vma21 [Trichoglossum hirsutum]|uniref:Vacuolar ATPase assembly integral membrane protein vma21 n=1 Tax=Trichoglossum hirsutum TaxID=265104 RepID=A0A9P8LDU9_9PEZI|nr:vacuolar ATPase assembly integral membrane protein vma21 [Trichoglossum hirsutum]
MASRRIASDEKDILDQDDRTSSPLAESDKSNITPAVPASVIIKLLAFTLAMIGGPIGTYFLTLHTVFKGNSTFAGATAAIMANFVLIAYVVVAMKEDQSERVEAEKKAKEKKGL